MGSYNKDVLHTGFLQSYKKTVLFTVSFFFMSMSLLLITNEIIYSPLSLFIIMISLFFLLIGIRPFILIARKKQEGIDIEEKKMKLVGIIEYSPKGKTILSIALPILILLFLCILIFYLYNFYLDTNPMSPFYIFLSISIITFSIWVLLTFSLKYIWIYENGIGISNIYYEDFYLKKDIIKVEFIEKSVKFYLADGEENVIHFSKNEHNKLFKTIKSLELNK